MIAQGSWWVRSDNDPRWNRNGRGLVGLGYVPDLEEWLSACETAFGKKPDDLIAGYMKD